MAVVLAAIFAGVLAGTFALVGNWLGGRREHRQWLRDARLAAYGRLATAVDEADLAATLAESSGVPTLGGITEMAERVRRLMEASNAVQLLGPEPMNEHAARLQSIAIKRETQRSPRETLAVGENVDMFVAAARAVLKAN